MTQAIDGTASGETIRMAFFSLNVPRFADKLIAAHKRGVNVRLLQDDHEIGYHWLRIVAAIGSNPANRSWAMLCHKSCMSDEDPSYLHAKLYMFSRTQGVPLVVMISSANPTFTQARIGWNDLYTMTGNSTMYTASRAHFERMTAGAIEDAAGDQSVGIPIDAYSSVASGIWKAYYFPKGGEGKADDPMYGVMTNIGCWGTAFGYGSGGRTVIKIAMYQWSELRVRLAEKLWELDDAGCIVEVIYNPTTTDQLIIDTLRKPGGKYGGVKVTPAHEDRNADGILEHFVHNKYMLVNGVYLGYGASKIVFAGSANWTNTALHYGNEIMLKVISNSTYDAYASQYARVLAWANSIPPPPPPTPTPGPTITAPPSLPPTPPPTVPPTVPPTAPPSPDPSASAPPSGAPLPNLPFADFGLDLSGALPNERLPEGLE